MAGLNDIPAAFLAVEADIANAAYAQGVKDLCVGVTALADFMQSIGFKAGPNDAAIHDEIEATAKRCIAACKADKTKMTAGGVDWKSLLSAMLMTFLSWWSNRPTPTP